MKGKASEVVETVSRRRVDLCCLQETRWKMEGVKQIVGKDSRYKLFCLKMTMLLVEFEFFWQRNGGRRCLRWSVSQTGSFSFV